MSALRTSPDAAPSPPPCAAAPAPTPTPATDPHAAPCTIDRGPDQSPAPFALALAGAGPERLARLARRHTAGTLVSALTHDLSQPLAAIGMYSSAAARMVELGRMDATELAPVLRQIETQVGRAGDLLARVRALTRLASPPAAAADLCRSVADAVALVRPLAAGKQIGIVLEAPPDPLPVAADPLQIAQVLLALLFNAVEAIEQADPAERQVVVSVRPEPAGALVTVRDTGPGIAPADLGRVFAGLPSAKPQGCGLGLVLSRLLIENQGGALWADPGAVGGAALHLRLPAATAADPGTAGSDH